MVCDDTSSLLDSSCSIRPSVLDISLFASEENAPPTTYQQLNVTTETAIQLLVHMASNTEAIELRHAPSPSGEEIQRESLSQSNNSLRSEIEQASLPPADHGKAAWLVLAGCSIIQLPVWGKDLRLRKRHRCTRRLTHCPQDSRSRSACSRNTTSAILMCWAGTPRTLPS